MTRTTSIAGALVALVALLGSVTMRTTSAQAQTQPTPSPTLVMGMPMGQPAGDAPLPTPAQPVGQPANDAPMTMPMPTNTPVPSAAPTQLPAAPTQPLALPSPSPTMALPMPATSPTAPPAPPAATWWATVRVRRANVRNMPTLRGSNLLGQVDEGVNVELHGKYAEWYRVRTPNGPLAWMHQSVLTVEPDVAQQVPAMSADLAMPTMAMPGAPQPTVDPMLAMNDASIVELPPGSPDGPASAPVSLTVRACLGGQSASVCNEGMGIRDLLIVVTDAGTARILGQVRTDARGVAQLAVPATDGAQVFVDAPSLNWNRSVQLSGDRAPAIPPIIVPAVALPWPLP